MVARGLSCSKGLAGSRPRAVGQHLAGGREVGVCFQRAVSTHKEAQPGTR